jgi:5-methylcytosine-specific restriction protein A
VLRPAVHVDHIKPHGGDLALFWDPKNWQGLCGSCHSTKTAVSDGGFGNDMQRRSGAGVRA